MTLIPSVAPEVPSRQARRAIRLDARYALWSLSSLKRVRACGRFSATKEGVEIKASGSVADGSRVAGLSGVQSCGSVWACPVCSAKIQAQRQLEVAAALAVARKKGWEVVFVTLTVRHKSWHKLRHVWDRVSVGWRAATSGSRRAWADDVARYGIQGYLRLVEVTQGENGWHVHAHALLFLDPLQAGVAHLNALGGYTPQAGFTDDDVDMLGASLFLRWKKAVGRELVPSFRRGVDVRRVRADDVIAEYFAKNVYTRKGEASTAYDVTGAHSKTTKHGNRTPFGILAGLVDVRTGEVGPDYDRELDLWHTFEKVSRGKRQLLWSNGLRKKLGLVRDEDTDQQIVDKGHDGEVVAMVPPKAYRSLAERGQLQELLEFAELDDDGTAVKLLIRDIELYLRT